MFLYQHQRYLKVLLLVSRFSTGSMFTWNNSLGRVMCSPTYEKSKFFTKLRLLLVLLFPTLIELQDIKMNQNSATNKTLRSPGEKVIVTAVLQNFAVATAIYYTMCKYGELIPAYVNGHLDLKSVFPPSFSIKHSNLEKLNVFFAYAVTPMLSLLYISATYGFYWMSPCKASLSVY